MKRIRGFLKFNPYLQDPTYTQTTVQLQEAFRQNNIKEDDITIMSGLIKYPRSWSGCDLWGYVDDHYQKQFMEDKNIFFLFDASTEGFSTIYDQPWFEVLYKMADKYDIDPQRILFVSSNMKDNENIIRYNMNQKRDRSINVFTYLNFEQQILGVSGQNEVFLHDSLPLKKKINRRLKNAKKSTAEKYKDKQYGKIGLSLSRINRPHRTFSTMDIFNSKYFKDMMVSHAKLKDDVNLSFYMSHQPFANAGTTIEELKMFKNQLPLIVDTEDFNTNHALALHNDLNDSTLFQIVNETHANDWQGTSLFYSEKTFRSVYNMQPFVIWGQAGVNKKLADYGYKTYEDWFDLSFDEIKDPAKRWRALWSECCKQIDHIRNMDTVEQQIQWKFKNEAVLKHNFTTLCNGKYTKDTFKQMALTMRNIADEKTINTPHT